MDSLDCNDGFLFQSCFRRRNGNANYSNTHSRETEKGSQAAHVQIKVGVNKDKGRYATRNDRSQE